MPGKAVTRFSTRVLAVAALLGAMSLSVQWSDEGQGRLSLGLSSAAAADMSIPVRRVARHRHYARLYDPLCGGPYVGGGINGGTYYGGPFMDLRCYQCAY